MQQANDAHVTGECSGRRRTVILLLLSLMAICIVVFVVMRKEQNGPWLFHVRVDWPSNGAIEMESMIGSRLRPKFRGMPDCDVITTIATEGHIDAYLPMDSGKPRAEALAQANEKLAEIMDGWLPAEATYSSELLDGNSQIPDPKPVETKSLKIIMDHDAMRRHSLTRDEVLTVIEEATAEIDLTDDILSIRDMIRELSLLPVSPDGLTTIDDIANIRTSQEFSHVTRTRRLRR